MEKKDRKKYLTVTDGRVSSFVQTEGMGELLQFYSFQLVHCGITRFF